MQTKDQCTFLKYLFFNKGAKVMQAKLLIGMAILTVTVATTDAAVVTDDFNGATLDPMWTLSDDAANYGPGGGFGVTGGKAVFQQLKGNNYGNLRTSLGNIGASDTARVDAIMRMEEFGAGRWSTGVAIYFDNDNWMQIRAGASGGESGWVRQGTVAGDTFTYDQQDVASGEMRWWYNIGGIELTDTEIRFYGSTIMTNHENETDIDANVSLISEFTMARPASFTGDAYAIIGKGMGGVFGTSPFLTNNGTAFLTPGNTLIDFARITTIPEPATMGLLVIGSVMMLGRVRRRPHS